MYSIRSLKGFIAGGGGLNVTRSNCLHVYTINRLPNFMPIDEASLEDYVQHTQHTTHLHIYTQIRNDAANENTAASTKAVRLFLQIVSQEK